MAEFVISTGLDHLQGTIHLAQCVGMVRASDPTAETEEGGCSLGAVESFMSNATLAYIQDLQQKPPVHFYDLSIEIRIQIYRLLLVTKTPVQVSFSRHGTNGQAYGPLMRGLLGSLAIGDRGATNIMRVSKQISRETTDVLYSQNHFRTFNATGFLHSFIHGPATGIGNGNTVSIKQASFGLPDIDQINSVADLGDFLDVVCNGLPGLHWLTVQPRFGAPGLGQAPTVAQNHRKSHRNMLYVAAWIVKRHPLLRAATWLTEEGANSDTAACQNVAWSHALMKTFFVSEMAGRDTPLDGTKIRAISWTDLLQSDDLIIETADVKTSQT